MLEVFFILGVLTKLSLAPLQLILVALYGQFSPYALALYLA